jgi:hypothetical protein
MFLLATCHRICNRRPDHSNEVRRQLNRNLRIQFHRRRRNSQD